MNKINIRVTILSLLALIFVILSIFVHWAFIIPAVILMLINQKELLGNRDGKNTGTVKKRK